MGIEVCFAGHWDIPVMMMQGDEAACREAKQQFPGIVTAAVKHAVSRDLCVGLPPEEARRITAQSVHQAVEELRAGRVAPYKPSLPMTVTIQMKTPEGAEAACKRPGVRQVDECTVEGVVEHQCDVVKWILGTGLDMPE